MLLTDGWAPSIELFIIGADRFIAVMKHSLRNSDCCVFLIEAPGVAGEVCSGLIDSCMSADHASIILIHASSVATQGGYFLLQASSFRNHPCIAGNERSLRDIDRDRCTSSIVLSSPSMRRWRR